MKASLALETRSTSSEIAMLIRDSFKKNRQVLTNAFHIRYVDKWYVNQCELPSKIFFRHFAVRIFHKHVWMAWPGSIYDSNVLPHAFIDGDGSSRRRMCLPNYLTSALGFNGAPIMVVVSWRVQAVPELWLFPTFQSIMIIIVEVTVSTCSDEFFPIQL